MKIDMTEIARRSGFSIATVSRVLNNQAPVKEKTRQTILQIASEHNYKPNSIARSLSRRKTETLGVILPDLIDEFFMDIVHGIDEEAHKNNRYILISSSHSQRNLIETSIEFMNSGRVDGIILMAPSKRSEVNNLIAVSKCPVILLNNNSQIENIVSFDIDNFNGAYSVTEHLIKHGYKKLAFISGPEQNTDSITRMSGYQKALQDYGLNIDQELIVTGDFTMRSGYYSFTRLMSQRNKPEAVFIANDMMALGAYQAAAALSLHIPGEVALVGFDDIFLSQLLKPRLTTVHAPIVELGAKATRYLIKMIEGEVDRNEPHTEVLATGLVIGGSCGCQNLAVHNLI